MPSYTLTIPVPATAGPAKNKRHRQGGGAIALVSRIICVFAIDGNAENFFRLRMPSIQGPQMSQNATWTGDKAGDYFTDIAYGAVNLGKTGTNSSLTLAADSAYLVVSGLAIYEI
jgi:hypothetical protein